MVQILWFKRDLRLADHAPLAQARARGPVLPIYIVEPALWAEPDASARQWAFARECLEGLSAEIALRGGRLRVFTGEAVAVLESLRAAHGAITLWSHEETGNGWTYARDLRVAGWARAQGVEWVEEPCGGVQRRLRGRDGWAASWAAAMARPLIPAPDDLRDPFPDRWPSALPQPEEIGLAPDPCPARQIGGRARGQRALQSFLSERSERYRFEMSSPLTATRACSRLSPHIAWGTVSLREIVQATQMRITSLPDSPEATRWRASLRAFLSRLHWHCHFIQKLEDAPEIEHRALHSAYEGLRAEPDDPARRIAFETGRTGYPFIDACLRALDQQGWINFRMRAMLMSFASYHLWLPWRETGHFLARRFVDYEAGIHWPQVQMQSGPTGINSLRIYNPVKQSHDQDPKGAFIRRYLPELARVPEGFLHEPWRADWACDYPAPIVDNAQAMRAARDALWDRRKAAPRAQTAEILRKHGSRKGASKPRTGGRKPDQRQFSLDL